MTKVSVTAGGFEILSTETFSMNASIYLDCGGLLWMDSIDEQSTLEMQSGNAKFHSARRMPLIESKRK